MNSNRRLKLQRERMFKKHPYCRFCNVKLTDKWKYKMQETKNGRVFMKRIGRAPDNFATIEHLRSRLHPGRSEQARPYEIRRVLCCYKCNHERNEAEMREYGKEEMRKRCAHGKSNEQLHD